MNVSSQLSVVCAANGHNKDKHGDEYIKLLSTVADNPDPPFWFKGHAANRDMLLCELTDAGFLKTEFCKDSVMATITYNGRQELDRLRSFRTKQRFEACVKWSAIIVAFATVVSAACAVVSCLTNESRRDASSLIENKQRSSQMEMGSMMPAAGSVPPSQRINNKSGYSKGSDPENVLISDEYERCMKEIAESSMSPVEKKAAISSLKRRLREKKTPYRH